MRGRDGALPIRQVTTRVLRIPTDAPESDGTFSWDSTSMTLVEVAAGDVMGLGYTYADASAATLVEGTFAPVLEGLDALDTRGCWLALWAAARNLGRRGLASYAISALDVALWDAKARALGVPLVTLLGRARDEVPVYASGGFTSYDDRRLAEQLSGWVEDGIASVKMKVGRDPDDDPHRVAVAREAIGDHAELFVDANGAYTVQQALSRSEAFAEHGVTWHEEPVSSDDATGLRHVRERIPAGMDVAAGEYATDAFDVRGLLHAEAVDCLQADVTRCGGVTGFLDIAALCWAEQIDVSAHTAPQVSLAVCAAVPRLRHLEYFHDHVRIEDRLFDGVATPVGGVLAPDLSRPGLGLTLRDDEARRFAV